MVGGLVHYAQEYSAANLALGKTLEVSDDLRHLHVGLATFAMTICLRRRIRSPWRLAAVAAFAVANEIVDYAEPCSATRSALDVVNTMYWPAGLFLLARRGRGVGTKV